MHLVSGPEPPRAPPGHTTRAVRPPQAPPGTPTSMAVGPRKAESLAGLTHAETEAPHAEVSGVRTTNNLAPRAEQTLGKAWAQAAAQLGRLLLPVTHTATSRPPQDVHICTTFHVGKRGQLSLSAKSSADKGLCSHPLWKRPL